MRVALITDGIWPYVLGGMQKHSFYLCKYLAQKKIYVDLFHFNQSEYVISELEFFSEEERKYISSNIVDFPKGLPFPGHYLYKSYKHSQLIFDRIKDKLSEYDLIYTKGFTGWYLIDQKFKKNIHSAPIGVKFHGYEMFQKAPDFKTRLQHILLLRRPVKRISQRADLVFSYGGKITDLIKSIGVEDSRIVEFPSGVEKSFLVEKIKPVNGKMKFLFLGRYERRKGIEELNTAIQSFFKSTDKDKAEFHFVGPIPEDKRIEHNVIYHGEVRDKQKLQSLIRNCDILICPSWSEGMPNVILEAMANGLAVIATDVGATNVLVSGSTGWLLKSSDPGEIKAALHSAVQADSSVINTKKQNALDQLTQNFTWEKLIEKFYNRFFN